MTTTKRRSKPQGAYEGTEDAFQVSAIRLVRSRLRERGLDERQAMHVPNGGFRHFSVAVKMKKMGVVKGYPDIMVFGPDIALELKVWPNKPTDEQVEVHDILRSCGWTVHVCYGLDEVDKAMEW